MALERQRPLPPPAHEDPLLALWPPRSLTELRDAVCAPGDGVPADVEALLAAMAQAPGRDEDPRERADVLLSLLEKGSQVGGLTGADGGTVREGAVEALLALGYPHALEVPPEALEQVRREQRARGSLPNGLWAVTLTVVAALAQFLLVSVGLFAGRFLSAHGHRPPALGLGLVVAVTCLPAMLALAGGALRVRRMQWLGSLGLGLQGTLWAGLACLALFSARWDTMLTALVLPWHLTWYAARLVKPAPVPRKAVPGPRR
jgi:hypothetical protein